MANDTDKSILFDLFVKLPEFKMLNNMIASFAASNQIGEIMRKENDKKRE